MKIRLYEKFTSEIFTGKNIPIYSIIGADVQQIIYRYHRMSPISLPLVQICTPSHFYLSSYTVIFVLCISPPPALTFKSNYSTMLRPVKTIVIVSTLIISVTSKLTWLLSLFYPSNGKVDNRRN